MRARNWFKPDARTLVISALCGVLVGCGGGSSIPNPPPVVAVRVVISPSTTNVNQEETVAFSAFVTGTTNTAVSWSVQEGPAGGSVSWGRSASDTGYYKAPSTPGIYHVIATSVHDPTKSATATVTVPEVSVSISPESVSLPVNLNAIFTGNVSGAEDTSMTWKVEEAAGGTLTSEGRTADYTAPGTPGTYHVIATSSADPTKSATATVTVTPPVLSVLPQSEILGPEGTRQFSASIAGMTDQTVTWSIREGSSGGSVDANGLYTAPAAQGTYDIVATSVADNSVTGMASITVGTHGFKLVTPLLEARANPTATLLQDGRVLIAGGCDNPCYSSGNGTLASAELFDPTTNSFSAAGSMSTARLGHTATRLLDGRVLLVGGFDATGNATISADLYDPQNGTFTPTGNLNTSRAYHTATLLSDGRVLVAGGLTAYGNQDVLASAEIYDPTNGTFNPTGSMTVMRWMHTATALADGKVLIAGGFTDLWDDSTYRAELFDPVAESFNPENGAGVDRGDFTSTLLNDGTVLLAGGADFYYGCCSNVSTWAKIRSAVRPWDPSGENVTVTATTNLYDSASAMFHYGPNMSDARYAHTAVRLQDGRVLVAGGIGNSDPGQLATVEIFNPGTVSFTQTGSLEFGVDSQAAVVLQDGRVLVVGGFDQNGTSVDLAEVYQ